MTSPRRLQLSPLVVSGIACAPSAGTTACADLTALASNDDSCDVDGGVTRLCSHVTFTRSAVGRYTILTGAFRAGGAYECHFETR